MLTAEAEFSPVPVVDAQLEVHDGERQTTTAAPSAVPRRFTRAYRGGFSSSICDLFSNPYERTSCCAITCCGTCLHDRNHYILTGELPPPWWARILVYVGGFILIMSVVTMIFSNSLIGFWAAVAFEVIMAIRATNIRAKQRKQIMSQLSQEEIQEFDNCGGFCADHRRAHRMMAFVPNDVIYQAQAGATAGGGPVMVSSEHSPELEDFCSGTWKVLASLCCGCCGCWCNCCGSCATGQEARELRRLVPKEQFWIDYITMQPFQEYYPAIEDLRRMENGGFLAHLGALSELSKKLLRILMVSIVLLLAASVFHILRNFHVAKVIIVVATLGQALAVLYFVHWRKNRFDLSLDAVIKFFASGFVLAMFAALVVELILSTIGNILVFIILALELAEEGYDPGSNPDIAQIAKSHPLTVLAYLFFSSFVVAALCEELAKFFSFWMVEHPDFFSSDPSFDASRNDAAVAEMGEENSNAVSNNFRPHRRSIHATAAATTVGLVATAAGFACVENLLYVFQAGGSSLKGEIIVLVLRSLLPLHPICGAIQSIGIVRRDVEGDRAFKLGKAILPAFILHGTFDFVIMALAFFRTIYWPSTTPKPATGTDESQVEFPVVDFVVGFVIMLLGIVYYVIEARKQRGRLNAMEASSLEAVMGGLALLEEPLEEEEENDVANPKGYHSPPQ